MNLDMQASEIFCQNLKDVVEQRHLKISELAKMVGIARPTMSDIINGKENVTLNRAQRIAQAIEVPLTSLLEEKAMQHA